MLIGVLSRLFIKLNSGCYWSLGGFMAISYFIIFVCDCAVLRNIAMMLRVDIKINIKHSLGFHGKLPKYISC